MIYKNYECFLEYTNLGIISVVLGCNKGYQKKFHNNSKKQFLIHSNILTMIPINSFYCSKIVFTVMNIWMTGKIFSKDSLPKKEDFY